MPGCTRNAFCRFSFFLGSKKRKLSGIHPQCSLCRFSLLVGTKDTPSGTHPQCSLTFLALCWHEGDTCRDTPAVLPGVSRSLLARRKHLPGYSQCSLPFLALCWYEGNTFQDTPDGAPFREAPARLSFYSRCSPRHDARLLEANRPASCLITFHACTDAKTPATKTAPNRTVATGLG